jgi:hypothetical protein
VVIDPSKEPDASTSKLGDGGRRFLRNVGNLAPDYKLSQTRLSYNLSKEYLGNNTCYLTFVPNPVYFNFFFPMAQQPLVGQGLLIIQASRSHSDTTHSVGLLWTSDQPDAETST